MATETKRVVKLKRIIDPSDPDPTNPTSFIPVPVVVVITFHDPGGSLGFSGGDFVRTFDSTANNTARLTHVHTVNNQSQDKPLDSGGTVTSDDANALKVERIDQIPVKNADQKEFVKFNDQDPAPLGPGDDPALGHLKTHVVRYNKANKNDPNETPWVDIELVDQFQDKGFLKQRKTRAGQALTYFLKNDPGDNSFSDPSDPYNPTFSDITFWGTDLEYLSDDTNGNPDPVRLDPFQNIVNINWGGLAVKWGETNKDAT